MVAAVADQRHILASIILGLLATKATAQVQCINPVDSHGERERIVQGDYSATVRWRQVALSRNTIGYGSAEQRAYELTIDHGKVHMVRPAEDGGFEVRHDPAPDGSAVMLQLATPSRWQAAGSLDAISSFDDLSFVFDEMQEDLGCGDDAVLPFRIEGHIQEATWSLDTRPKNHVGHAKAQRATIVGIYSSQNKKRLFMVPGYNLHAHIVLHGNGLAGHLRNLTLDEGAQLYLPGQ